jgi:hypothetical protein
MSSSIPCAMTHSLTSSTVHLLVEAAVFDALFVCWSSVCMVFSSTLIFCSLSSSSSCWACCSRHKARVTLLKYAFMLSKALRMHKPHVPGPSLRVTHRRHDGAGRDRQQQHR